MDGIFAAHADSDAFFWKSDSSRRPTQAASAASGRIRAIPGRFARRGARASHTNPARASMMPTSVARVTDIVPRVAFASRASTRRANGAVASRRAHASRGGFRLPNGRSAVRNVPRDGVRVVPSPRARPSRVPRVDRPPRTPLRTPPYAPRRARARRRRPRARVRRGPRDRHLALVQPTDPWGVWAAILCASSFGLWGNKQRWGARVGGASLLHPPRPFPQQRRRHPDGGAADVHGRDKVSPAPRGSAFAAHRRPATRRHVHGESVVVFLPRKRGHRLGLHPGTSDVKREETAGKMAAEEEEVLRGTTLDPPRPPFSTLNVLCLLLSSTLNCLLLSSKSRRRTRSSR